MTQRNDRRRFLKTSAAAASTVLAVPYWFTGERAVAAENESKNDRHVIGCIGHGSRWDGVIKQFRPHGDVVAICDVDRRHAEAANAKVGGKADLYGDYRKLLDRKDIDCVTVITPDHWHTKIAIEAMRAG